MKINISDIGNHLFKHIGKGNRFYPMAIHWVRTSKFNVSPPYDPT